jgi:hypothetical protein
MIFEIFLIQIDSALEHLGVNEYFPILLNTVKSCNG